MLSLILLILAMLLFLIAAMLPPPYEPWRNRLGLFGLFCWTLSEVIGRALPHT